MLITENATGTKLYAASVTMYRSDRALISTPCVVWGDDRVSAIIAALDFVKENLYLPTEGYYGYQAAVLEIPISQMEHAIHISQQPQPPQPDANG